MSYRHKLSYIPKKVYNKIKSLDIQGVNKYFGIDSDQYGEVWVGEYLTEIYEFGEWQWIEKVHTNPFYLIYEDIERYETCRFDIFYSELRNRYKIVSHGYKPYDHSIYKEAVNKMNQLKDDNWRNYKLTIV